MKLSEPAKVVLVLGLLIYLNTHSIPNLAPSLPIGALCGLLASARSHVLNFLLALSVCVTFGPMQVEPWGAAFLYTQTLVVFIRLAFKKGILVSDAEHQIQTTTPQ